MKAYLRFRLPWRLAESLSTRLAATFGMSDNFLSNDQNHLHIVLAEFGFVNPEQIKSLNDAIALAYVQFRQHPPTIKLEGFGISKSFSRNHLIIRATIDPFKEWDDARTCMMRYMDIGTDGRVPRDWEPHVALGTLKDESVPKTLNDTYVWRADQVELVLQMKSTEMILPWKFD